MSIMPPGPVRPGTVRRHPAVHPDWREPQQRCDRAPRRVHWRRSPRRALWPAPQTSAGPSPGQPPVGSPGRGHPGRDLVARDASPMILPRALHTPWLTAFALVTAAFQLLGSPTTGRQFFPSTSSTSSKSKLLPMTTAAGPPLRSSRRVLNSTRSSSPGTSRWHRARVSGSMLCRCMTGAPGVSTPLAAGQATTAAHPTAAAPLAGVVANSQIGMERSQTDVLVLSRPRGVSATAHHHSPVQPRTYRA